MMAVLHLINETPRHQSPNIWTIFYPPTYNDDADDAVAAADDCYHEPCRTQWRPPGGGRRRRPRWGATRDGPTQMPGRGPPPWATASELGLSSVGPLGRAAQGDVH